MLCYTGPDNASLPEQQQHVLSSNAVVSQPVPCQQVSQLDPSSSASTDTGVPPKQAAGIPQQDWSSVGFILQQIVFDVLDTIQIDHPDSEQECDEIKAIMFSEVKLLYIELCQSACTFLCV